MGEDCIFYARKINRNIVRKQSRIHGPCVRFKTCSEHCNEYVEIFFNIAVICLYLEKWILHITYKCILRMILKSSQISLQQLASYIDWYRPHIDNSLWLNFTTYV